MYVFYQTVPFSMNTSRYNYHLLPVRHCFQETSAITVQFKCNNYICSICICFEINNDIIISSSSISRASIDYTWFGRGLSLFLYDNHFKIRTNHNRFNWSEIPYLIPRIVDVEIREFIAILGVKFSTRKKKNVSKMNFHKKLTTLLVCLSNKFGFKVFCVVKYKMYIVLTIAVLHYYIIPTVVFSIVLNGSIFIYHKSPSRGIMKCFI